ncbi:MAG: LPS assembly protein LptD [bacterium]
MLSSAAGSFFARFGSMMVQPEEEEPIYVRHADRFESATVNGRQVTTFIGHVEIEHKETRITCERATYFEHEGRVLLEGDVEIVQSMRTIRADRVEYFERTREVIARGDPVQILGSEKGVTAVGGHVGYNLDSESGHLTTAPSLVKRSEDNQIEATLTGDMIELYSQESRAVARGDSVQLSDLRNNLELLGKNVSYHYDREYAVATGRPTIVRRDEEEKLLMTLVSDTVEVFSRDDRLVAAGDVRIEREKFVAESGRAFICNNGERVILKGNPVLRQSTNRLTGDEIELTLEDSKVTRVQTTGRARAISTSRKDTTGERVELSELTGGEITLYLRDEEAENLVVAGNASSLYHLREGRGEGARNEASGDTITLFFLQGEIDRTLVVGGARGTYYAPPSGEQGKVDTVMYRADRIEYKVADEAIFLDGDNRIEYQNIVLTAGHITYNTETDILTAEGVPDLSAVTDTAQAGSAGRLTRTPVLKDGEEEIEGVWLDYNLKTRRGKIRKGETRFEKGFYKGERIRKVADRVLNIDHGTYTTCDHNKPHYRFYTRRMKFYQNDKVIAKPVVLYIGDVPLFGLPFYIFPIKKGRHSGLLVPRYGSTDVDGRYLRDAGYYFAPSDYWDALVKFSLYEWTGWMLESRFRYGLRYRFSGSFGGSYRWDRRYVGSKERRTKRWNFRLDHTHTVTPALTLKASGDFVSDKSYYQDVSDSPLERMERILRSEMVLDKRWEGSSLSLRLSHERNLDKDRTTQNLPILTFRKSQSPIFGSSSRSPGGGKKGATQWYHSLYYSYNLLFVNWRRSQGSTDEKHTGADHRLDLSGPQTVAGWLGITPWVRLRETWYDKDTEGRKWVRRGYYEASLSVNTTLYGLFRPKIGPLTLVRHKVQPRLSFTYRPDFRNKDRYYSFGGIGGVPGPQKTLGIGVSNFFQGKSVNEEGERKLDIATLDISTGYDFRADGQKFSAVNTALRIYPSKSLNLDLSASHSLYRPETGQFEPWHPILRRVSVTTTFHLRSAGGGQSIEMGEESFGERVGATPFGRPFEMGGAGEQKSVSRKNPWNVTFSHNYSLSKSLFSSRTHWFSGRLSFYLTENWKIDYSGRYDLEQKRFAAQRVAFYRDLHCWEAQFVWVPTGGREGYYFKVNIKALPEVKIERGRGIARFGL